MKYKNMRSYERVDGSNVIVLIYKKTNLGLGKRVSNCGSHLDKMYMIFDLACPMYMVGFYRYHVDNIRWV